MVDIVKDVQKAQAWLRENTNKAALFEKRYGEGSALAVLNGTYQAPAVPDAPTESGADGMLEDVLKSIPAGITNAVRETTQFVGDLMEGASNLVGDETMIHRVDRDGDGKLDLLPMIGNKETYAKYVAENFEEGDRPANLQEIAEVITPENVSMGIIPNERSTMVGGFTEGITQFLAGMVGAGKLTGLKPLKSIGGGMATGAIADAVAFDPDTANLVRMLDEQFGISAEITTEILANDDENDWMNRLKNAGTGTLIGAPFDAAAILIRFAKVKIKAQQELNTNGEISKETLDEAQALEEEVTKFSDLAGKPKGQMVEGKFVTDDGMVFDPSTGARDLQAEAKFKNSTSKVDTSEAPTAPKASSDSPTSPEIPSAPVATSLDSAAPKQPKAPKAPSSVVNVKALKDAAVRARKLNEGQVVQLSDINQMGDSVGLFNYSKMDGPLDAVKVMDQIHDALDACGVLKSMKLDKRQSLDEVKRLAMAELKDIAGDPRMVAKNFAQLEAAGRDIAPRIVAGKMALQSTGKQISELVDQIENLKLTRDVDTQLERKLVDMLELHADLQASVKGMQTASARAVSAGRIRTADELGDVTLDRLAQYGGSKKVQKLAAQLKGAKGNPAAVAKIVRKDQNRGVWGVINEVWLNAILSGPRTHAMNIGSNSINLLMRPAQRMVGGTWGVVTPNPRRGKADRQASIQQIEEGARQYMYLMSELGDSLKYLASGTMAGRQSAMADAFRSWYREEGVLDTASKFDFEKAGNSRAIGGITGKLIRGAGRTLQAEDEFFKQLVFRSRLKAKVMANSRRLTDEQLGEMGYVSREAYIEDTINGAQLTKENLTEKWEEMVLLGKVTDDAKAKELFINENIGTYNHSSSMAKVALDEAREATFTTPLREGTLGKKVQEALNQHPILRQVMPFIQTPTNILRVSFERVPVLGLWAGRQRQLLREGTPDQRAMVIGQQAVGIAVTAVALDMALQGRITGGGPSYKRELNKAKLWNASPDWHPYSINIGDSQNPQWVELKKLDPHGLLFGVMGDLYEMMEYTRENPDPEVSELFAMVAASVASNVMSKTYLMSLNDTMNIFNGGAKPWEIKAFVEGRIASAVPYSGLQYQMNQMGDDHMRDLRTLTDKVKARIYGMNTGAVKHDWLTGEAVDTPEYMLGFVRQKKVDSGEHVASRVYDELRRLNHGFAGPQRKMEGLELPPELFQRYNQLVGSVTLGNKRTLIQELDRKIRTSGYQKLTLEAEIAPVASADDPRVRELNIIIEAYKKAARIQLMEENPKLFKTLQNNKMIKRVVQRGGDRNLMDGLVKEFSITQ